MDASGAGGLITANGIDVLLPVANTIGGLAQSGGSIRSDNGTLTTTAATTANSANQTGFRATGSGSSVIISNSILTMGPAAAVAANGMTGLSAQAGGSITASGVDITMRSAVTGLNNHALYATGAGSLIAYDVGTIFTSSRVSFGAFAEAGGQITLDNAQITTTGVGTAAIQGGHGIVAIGAGSSISGANNTITANGNFSSPVRAEQAGSISLDLSSISSAGTSAVDTDPTGVRVMTGGSLLLTNSTVSTTGQRGTGIAVQNAGSIATLTDTNITTTGDRANALYLFDAAQANVTRGILTSSGLNAALIDSGSTASFTATDLRGAGGPTIITYGLRAIGGSTVTMTGGSSSTIGRDSPGIAASGGGSVTATGVTVSTTGTDNAMGVAADLNGQITFNGGSVTTTGDEVRSGARAHAFVARNPGGVLTSDGTILSTSGLRAMGVVADDGGVANLSNTRITTSGLSGIGIFTVTEQTGTQFAASATATDLVVNTSGELAHGITSQSRNDISTPLALTTVTRATIGTTGLNAVGLRAVLGDYGTRPISGRGEARVVANDTTVTTSGTGAHGALSLDNPTSVTMSRSSVTSSGSAAHGSVAEAGGLIVGNQSIVRALGANSAALFVIGTPTAVSTGNYTDSVLTNVSGATIGVAGNGDVSLTRSTAGGSGEWLRVGRSTDFTPTLSIAAPITGVPDLPDPDPAAPPPTAVPPPSPRAPAPVVPGLANVTLTNSTVTGSAFTAPGSISNLTLIDSTWIMTGNSNITNLVNDPSLIQYTPPVGDPTQLASYKTLTVVNYIGIDGQLGLNTFLGNDASPSDRLVINGGNASGSSPLLIANTTGLGDLTTGNGILVVEAQNGGTTNPGTFTLGRPVVAGPYEYSLYRSSVDASGPENWYLRSSIQPGPGPAPGPTPSPIPDYRRETSLYAALPAVGLIYGRTIIDSLHERIGEQRLLEAPAVTEERTIWCKNPEQNFRCTTTVRLPESALAASRSYASLGWGRIIGTHGNHDGGPGGIFRNGPNFDYDIFALQAGVDLYRGINTDGSRDQAGVYAAIGRIEGDVRHFNGIKAGTNTIDGYSLGAYWTHFGASGWYLDGVVQGTWFDAEADSKRLLKLNRDGFGIAASLEGGYPIALGNGWTIEPQAQLVYQTIANGSGHDGAALVRFSDVDSLAGRIGARLARSWALDPTEPKPRLITTWLKASLWNEFLGNPKTSFSSAAGPVAFRSDLGGSWAEFKAGVDAQIARNTALYASAGYSFGTDGRSHAYEGRVGLKVTW